jgi:uncharacterized protein RhaS with RHS repeats
LYDSEIGRFLGVDPLAGKFAGWSPYNYVLGNPVRLVDPDGAAAEDPRNKITTKVTRKITAYAVPETNGVRLVESYKKEVEVGHNYRSTGGRHNRVTESRTVTSTSTEVVLDQHGDVVSQSQTSETREYGPSYNSLSVDVSSSSTSGDAVNLGSDIKSLISGAKSHAQGEQESDTGATPKSYMHVLSGNKARGEVRRQSAKVGGANTIIGFLIPHPVGKALAGFSAIIGIANALEKPRSESEAEVKNDSYVVKEDIK